MVYLQVIGIVDGDFVLRVLTWEVLPVEKSWWENFP